MPKPPTLPAVLLIAMTALQFPVQSQTGPLHEMPFTVNKPRIQVAILLDVSNSMDGLIDQAKNQLWNIIKLIGQVRCNGEVPEMEIALYEYGRNNNDPQKGYVEKISGFTRDLDKFYLDLTRLTTRGGDEFCGHAISTSADSLDWDASSNSYKVIFIAGNESFLQGSVSYFDACNKVKQKGIIVNTIFCGTRERGIAENWDLNAECGNGHFTNIDQNAKPVQIPTPYDSALIVANKRLTENFVPYGESGAEGYAAMKQVDTVATYDIMDIDKIVGYVVVRADTNLYRSSKWNLVEAYEEDQSILEKIDPGSLTPELQNLGMRERKDHIEKKLSELKTIRKEIGELNNQRDKFIAAEKLKATGPSASTLGSEVEKIIKQQIIRYNMLIE